MSTFKVEILELERIYEHTNADALELGQVKGLGFQFVIQKGVYAVGDKVVYFPIDSVLPQSLIDTLGIKYLAGKEHNRVRTVKLRKEISQGMIFPAKEIADTLGLNYPVGTDITEKLGVTKYEPPVVMSNDGRLEPLPDGVPVYDIEGADRYETVLQYMRENNTKLYVTEKIEGTNFSVTARADGTVFVNSKNRTIYELDIPLPRRSCWHFIKDIVKRVPKRIPEKKINPYWEIARKQGLIDLAKRLLQNGHTQITVRGEMAGPSIQKNIYKLKEHTVYVFDIMADGHYLDVDNLRVQSLNQPIQFVPELASNVTLDEWLGGSTMQKSSDGKSQLAKTLREGIVLKPMTEERHDSIGRLILKQRSPEYLAKEKD